MSENNEELNQDTNFEAEATAQGWKPQAEWSGDPEKWVDAKTFVTRAQEWVGPLKKEISALRTTMRQVVETGRRQQQAVLQEARNRESQLQNYIAQLTAQRDAAIAASDASEAVKLERNLASANQELAVTKENVKQTSAEAPDPELVQTANDFKARNRMWYGADQMATKDADTIGQIYSSMYPEKSLSEVLEHVEEQIFSKYPNYAPSKTRTGGPQSGNSGVRNVESNTSPTKLKWENLDEDTRLVGEQLIKRKVFKDKKDYLASLDSTDNTIDIAAFTKK